MTVLENWQYGDPEYVAMRKEEDELRKARACGECMHRKSMEFRGEVVNICDLKRRTYGRRCELFEIKKGEA